MSALVLFDLDGTLVDSAPDLCAAANWLRSQHGLAPLPYSAMRNSAGKGARGLLWASLRLPTDAAQFPAEKKRFLEYYGEHLNDSSNVFEGIFEMLDMIESRGWRGGIVTNKACGLARPICEKKGLLPRAACLIGGDTTGKLKPAPDSLFAALRTVKASPDQCVYVGDDARDAAAAHAAGVKSIAAVWGYGGSLDEISRWNAHAVAHKPLDVVEATIRLLNL